MPNDEDIAAEIANLIRPWRGYLLNFSGPTSEDAIRWAEQELGVTFPRTYRVFLRHHGSGRVNYCRVLGLAAQNLWADVVVVNHMVVPRNLRAFVMIAESVDDHNFFNFYLDTARPDEYGEYPVMVVGPGTPESFFADNFLEFLRKVCSGLGKPRVVAHVPGRGY